MKLDEYIRHLQELRERYAGLDIDVTRPHPRTQTNAGLYVIPARAPVVWPVEADAPNLCLVPEGSSPLEPAIKPKGSGPDGVIIVFDID